MVGQTVTEQSHVEVHKDDMQLTIKSKLPLNEERVILKTCNFINIFGSAVIKVCTDSNFTGEVCIENSQRLKYKVKVEK